MIFRLVEPAVDMEKQYDDYISEWEATGEKVVPSASKRNSANYRELLKTWREQTTDKAYEKGLVPASLYFLIDEYNRIYGALHIRHELNDYLLNYGGHIGYGIRPSERRKGYATKMLSLSLPIAGKLGIRKALITCDKENISSANTIINNGGVLENEVLNDGEITQRYWIDIE